MLRSLQEERIAKLYSTLSILLNSDAPNEALLAINGLLLECVPGPTLSDIVESARREKWQSTVD